METRDAVSFAGCLLMAKNAVAFEMGKRDCYSQGFVRDYVALTHGSFGHDARSEHRNCYRGLISAPVDTSTYSGTRRCQVHSRGAPSITQYECLAEYESVDGSRYTLLHLRLLTGRTHQIRVHCETWLGFKIFVGSFFSLLTVGLIFFSVCGKKKKANSKLRNMWVCHWWVIPNIGGTEHNVIGKS